MKFALQIFWFSHTCKLIWMIVSMSYLQAKHKHSSETDQIQQNMP